MTKTENVALGSEILIPQKHYLILPRAPIASKLSWWEHAEHFRQKTCGG